MNILFSDYIRILYMSHPYTHMLQKPTLNDSLMYETISHSDTTILKDYFYVRNLPRSAFEGFIPAKNYYVDYSF